MKHTLIFLLALLSLAYAQRVDLDGFKQMDDTLWMAEKEVSNLDWKNYTASVPADQQAATMPDTAVWERMVLDSNDFQPYQKFYYQHPGFFQYPVVGISYRQAQTYCLWLQDELASAYPDHIVTVRLPSQHEWLQAARVGWLFDSKYPGAYTDVRFKKGRFAGNHLANIFWKGGHSTRYHIPAPVGSYFRCPAGLYDMLGNVAEMTLTEGVALGGSWAHTAQQSAIDQVQAYSEPTCWLGFRPVVVIAPKSMAVLPD